MWNDLPTEVVTASSVNAFKSKLEAHRKKPPYTDARVTGIERIALAFVLVFLLVL